MKRIIFISSLLFVLGFSSSAAAADLHVGPSQTYTTIQNAVNNASIGDTILVHPDTYYENINITNKDLLIKGVGGAGSVIIDGNGTTTLDSTVYIYNSYITLEGVTIQGGYALGDDYYNPSAPFGSYGNRSGGGIDAGSSQIQLRNMKLVGNRAEFGGGGMHLSNCTGSAVNVQVTGNVAENGNYGGGGVFVENGSDFYFNSVTIAANQTYAAGKCEGGGISVNDQSSINVVNSILWGNRPQQIGAGFC